jgi:N-acetylmuramoyl-L-alanine amidase CwlA
MPAPINVSVWYRGSGGRVVYLHTKDHGADVEIEFATGHNEKAAIEAAQERAAKLVRELQRLHDCAVKGEVVRI